jgi:hypothetical protein
MNKNFIFLAIIFICSCTTNKTKLLVFDEVKQVDIECIPIPYSDILGISLQLLKKDSLLFINDFHGDSLIHVLDVKNHIEHDKLVSKGVGPNEFMSPLAIYLTDSTFYIFERRTFRLFSFPIDRVLSIDKRMKFNFTANTPDIRSMINIVFPLSDSMFIFSKIDDSPKRFAIHNKNGERMNEFGEYKAYWYRENDFSNRVREFYHNTFFEKHPSKKKFIAYSGHILGIYSYESIHQAPVLLKEFLFSQYRYTFSENDMYLSTERDDGVERGILNVFCSSNYIYIVYNPNKEGEDKSLAHLIKIIDWNGNPIKILKPNKIISCLTIDETEKRGYIIAEDPDDTLMYFDLDE